MRFAFATALCLAVAPLAAPLGAQAPAPMPTTIDVPVPTPVQAPAPAPVHRFAWLADATFEYGGDILVTLIFDDGSEQDIRAGQGGTFSFGFEYRPPALPQVGIRSTAGVKFTSNASDNASISFLRFPIEVVGSYHLPRDWRIGAGLSYHTGVNFNGDGFVPDVAFDPATGATVEIGWRWVALTYTAIEYKANGGSLDASSLGLSLNWVFAKRN